MTKKKMGVEPVAPVEAVGVIEADEAEGVEIAGASGPVAVAAETMLGDLMAFLIDEFKAAPNVWQKMSEQQQRALIDRCNSRCRTAIGMSIEVLASGDRPTLVASVEKVEFKDGVKATLTMNKSNPARHDLADAQGSEVLLVIMHKDEHMGGDGKVKAEKDQKPLFNWPRESAAGDSVSAEKPAAVASLSADEVLGSVSLEDA